MLGLNIFILAHGNAPDSWDELLRAWAWEPLPLIGLGLSAYLYIAGVARTWRASQVGHGIKRWEAACFAAGWFACFIALISPLHPWGRVLFSAHMTQHEILMLIAAPLMVLGRPMVAFLRALPRGMATSVAMFSNTESWRAIWSTISHPLAAFLIHGIVLWVWHIPALFQSVLDNEWMHALQHTSFLFSALLFWWAIIHVENRAVGYGAAVLYMFTTALHSGLLGALLTFASRVWYPAYSQTTNAWGLTPLEDQQLGGLIMWIPAGVVYVVAGLCLVAGWLRESEKKVLQREERALAIGGAP